MHAYCTAISLSGRLIATSCTTVEQKHYEITTFKNKKHVVGIFIKTLFVLFIHYLYLYINLCILLQCFPNIEIKIFY